MARGNQDLGLSISGLTGRMSFNYWLPYAAIICKLLLSGSCTFCSRDAQEAHQVMETEAHVHVDAAGLHHWWRGLD